MQAGKNRGGEAPPRRGVAAPEGPFGWAWDQRAAACRPVGAGKVPATVSLRVPTAGEYRLWLRFRADPRLPLPVTVNLRHSGKNQSLVFGREPISSDSSRLQEKARPIRFEDEAIRTPFPAGAAWIWEYRDVALTRGTLKLELLHNACDRIFVQQFIFYRMPHYSA